MNRTYTADGVMITLDDVQADEEFVVINFSVQDLEDDRRNAGMPVALDPMLASGLPEALPPHCGRLTDAAGRRYELYSRNRVVMELTGRPFTNLSHVRSRICPSASFVRTNIP